MASLALRRLAGKNFVSGSILRPLTVSRSFNTNAQMARVDHDHDLEDRSDRAPVSRRRDFPASFFSDVLDPFAPTRSVGQLMNLMDQLMENPFRGIGSGGAVRRGWDVREDEEALQLKVDMPGLAKEDVKVSVEDNTLIIKGEAEKETEEEEQRRRYSSRIELTPNLYKIDGIKAEMKNGVLKVIVPKLKEEEKKDVFNVMVD
ncbi:small heat shock protein, chloroplastic-like [Chenopodium quinoa]|uniref:SHSP domain-containing protein n=1 Tax=Chenopodium quinoa TaxID=63459 RepID=A0A803N3T3_CHEQI|nr:small heat shock protein, chloroplastic-like [Chenopodium quinoa]